MILEFTSTARIILEECMQLKPTETMLVLSDTYPSSVTFAQVVAETARSMGVETTILTISPREIAGHEPPKAAAAAMKSVNKIYAVWRSVGIAHTNARKEATTAGAKYFTTFSEIGDDYLANLHITSRDFELMKERTERIADMLSDVKSAIVTSKLGTDFRISLRGRSGMAVHPTARGALSIVPDYAEATIAPVEESGAGAIVFDVEMIGWARLLREPLRVTVRKGRVVEVEGDERDSSQVKKTLGSDENANLLAEFALGTSHTIPSVFRGTRWDAGIMGMVHIAFGRNNDIGGKTYSRTHIDGVLSAASVELDGRKVLREGVLQE